MLFALAIALAIVVSGCMAQPRSAEPSAHRHAGDIGRPDNRVEGRILFPPRVSAGGRLRGTVPPGSQVVHQGRYVPVGDDGRIDWPVPGDTRTLRLRITRPDGRVLTQQIQVQSGGN